MPPQDLKDIPEVVNFLRFQLNLDYHVVYINLNIFFPSCGLNILVNIL